MDHSVAFQSVRDSRSISWRARIGLLAVFSGHAGLAMIYDALPPVLIDVAKHFGGGARGQLVAQFASSLPFFGIMLAGLLASYPIRRWGVRSVLVVTLILFGVVGTAGALITEAWLFLASRFLLGAALGTMITCCVSYVAVSFDEVFRAQMAGWMLAFGCACGVVFILISGYAASLFGWRMPFLLHALVSVAFLVPALCMDQGKVTVSTQVSSANFSRMRVIYPVLAIAVLLLSTAVIFNIQFALLMGGLPWGTPTAVGWVFGIQGGAAAAAAYGYARWFVGVSPRVLAAWCFAFMAGGISLAAQGSSLEIFVGAALIFGAASALAQASLFTWAMQTAPAELVTSAMGLMFTSLYFGAAAGPALTAPLPILLGVRPFLLLVSFVIVIGLGLVTLATKRQRR